MTTTTRRRTRVEDDNYNQKRNGRGNGEEWELVRSKKDRLKEKRFLRREERLSKTTSFYVSNLPEECKAEDLWNAFVRFGNLEDVYIPAKRDKQGNRFGFLKFSKIEDAETMAEELNGVTMEGAVLGVNVARYSRGGRSLEEEHKTARKSVFNGMENKGSTSSTRFQSGGNIVVEANTTSYHDSFNSYKDAFQGNKTNPSQNLVIDLPPVRVETKRRFELKTLMGDVKEFEMLNKLHCLVNEFSDWTFDIKFLGGLSIALIFDNAEIAEAFIETEVEKWMNWFTKLVVWNGGLYTNYRIAWVKIMGVPASKWDRHIFNKVGERLGRIIIQSNASSEDVLMEANVIAVLMPTGKSLPSNACLKSKDGDVWISIVEVVSDWSPAIPSPSVKAPAIKSIVVNGRVPADDEEESLGSSRDCMGMFLSPRACNSMGNSPRASNSMGSFLDSSGVQLDASKDSGEINNGQLYASTIGPNKGESINLNVHGETTTHAAHAGGDFEENMGGSNNNGALLMDDNINLDNNSDGINNPNNVLNMESNMESGPVLINNNLDSGIGPSYVTLRKKDKKKKKSVHGSEVAEQDTSSVAQSPICGKVVPAAVDSPLPFGLSFAPKPRKKVRPKPDPLDLTLGSAREIQNLLIHGIPRIQSMEVVGKEIGKIKGRRGRVRKGVKLSRF